MQKIDWRSWPLAMKLTFMITAMVVIVVATVTLLSIRREQEVFRAELQQQMVLLLGMMAIVTEDSLYALDADSLTDLMEKLSEEGQVLTLGRIYDKDGRVIADAFSEALTFQLEPDSFGAQLLTQDKIVFEWGTEQLLAGKSIVVGREVIGAIGLGLPTAPLTAKIALARRQGFALAFASVALGALLALIFSRSITVPLQELVQATKYIAEGDLTREIYIQQGEDELAVLSRAMERMRVELAELYENLGQQVAERTTELEERNQQLRREIVEREQIEASLALARDKALEASHIKSELLANASHELRTPLAAILGYAELLAEGVSGDLTDKQQMTLMKITKSAHNLADLVNDLLDQSKLEAGKLKLDIVPFLPVEVVDNVVSQLRMLAERKGIVLTSIVSPDLPITLYGDPNRIQQILVNLTSNAIKFTTQGSVSIRLYRLGKTRWAIEVKDSGIGVPTEAQPYIFEPFRQVDGSSTRIQGGTGLGLSIVKELTSLMGGEILLESKVGQGSTFTILLPLTVKDKESGDVRG